MDQSNGTKRLRAVSEKKLYRQLENYIAACRQPPNGNFKKDIGKLPNLAGFCRFLGCGCSEATKWKKENPTMYDRICTILEDEALNVSVPSPTLLNLYLKRRLGYAEESEAEGDNEAIRLIFEHDIEEDGA